MMDAKGVRNMYSILVVVNKHNTARVASCWFIIYYLPLPFTYDRRISLYLCQVNAPSEFSTCTAIFLLGIQKAGHTHHQASFTP